MRYTQKIKRNRPTAKKTSDALALTLRDISKIPNSANPIPLQKGQNGYFLLKVYYFVNESFIFSYPFLYTTALMYEY